MEITASVYRPFVTASRPGPAPGPALYCPLDDEVHTLMTFGCASESSPIKPQLYLTVSLTTAETQFLCPLTKTKPLETFDPFDCVYLV